MERRGRGFRYSRDPRSGPAPSHDRDPDSGGYAHDPTGGTPAAQAGRGRSRGQDRGRGQGRDQGQGRGRGRDQDRGQGRGQGQDRGRGGSRGGRGGPGAGHSDSVREAGNASGANWRAPAGERADSRRGMPRPGPALQEASFSDCTLSKSSTVSSESTEGWHQVHAGKGRQGQGGDRRLVSSTQLSSAAYPSPAAFPHTTAAQAGSGLSIANQGGLTTSGGTKGRPITVKANFFAIEHFNMETAFHYDVVFNPDRPKRLFRFVIEELRQIHFPERTIAFDGRKNAYTMIPLMDVNEDVIKYDVKVFDGEKNREKEFQVSLKLVARVDLSKLDQKCIHVLEVVLGSAAAMKYASIGRSFFSFSGRSARILDGMEVRSGLHLSVKRGQGLYVNMDSVHRAFLVPQSLLDTIAITCSPSQNVPLQNYQVHQLKCMLKGTKVKYSISNDPDYLPRVYSVHDVLQSPSQLTFEFNGTNITVEHYYEHEKHVVLRHKNLPCLNLGSSTKPMYVPVEFCTIAEGQLVQKQLNAKQSSEFINKATTTPSERMKEINDGLKNLDFTNSPQIKEFGIKIKPEFQQVQARVLNPPSLQYCGAQQVFPKNGEWHSETPFLQSIEIKKWTIIILDRCIQLEEAQIFANQLREQGKKLGMTIHQPHLFKSVNTRSQYSPESCLERELSNLKEFDLVIVVGFDNKRTQGNVSTYKSLKKVAELKIGVCTQYVTNTTLRKQGISTIIHNIIQKLNTKLQGVNHALSKAVVPSKFSKAAVMYVGADVTHPALGEMGTPSVAAVCASHDDLGFQYNIQIRIQQSKEEIIPDLENVMIEHLKMYEKNMNKKPEIILFFRDGVGEGQFDAVRTREITAIQRACSRLDFDYKPKITFLVVQKRHRGRLFPTQQNFGRNQNVPPGTVVDNTITNPEEREFYLVSHNSPRGVSRPCRYHCLLDDNDLTEDELQEISYYLCFMYSRCERSVSYPTPTYYAHHAATRGKLYLQGEHHKYWSNQFLEKHSSVMQKLPPMYFI